MTKAGRKLINEMMAALEQAAIEIAADEVKSASGGEKQAIARNWLLVPSIKPQPLLELAYAASSALIGIGGFYCLLAPIPKPKPNSGMEAYGNLANQ